MDFDSLIRETVGRVLEGGKALGGDRIDRANVQPTIDAFKKQVLAQIPHRSIHPIGSTGIKDTSGDIDLAIETDLNAREVAELVGELGFEKKLFPGLDQVSILFPQHGRDGVRLPRWIQVDLIVGDPAYLKWAHPSPADSRYKGFYTRAIANAIIRVTTGKHVNVTRGVFSKEEPKKYSTDVASLAKQIGQGWTAEDLTGSLEKIWDKCKASFTPEQLQGIRDYVREFMENKKAPFPEELNEVVGPRPAAHQFERLKDAIIANCPSLNRVAEAPPGVFTGTGFAEYDPEQRAIIVASDAPEPYKSFAAAHEAGHVKDTASPEVFARTQELVKKFRAGSLTEEEAAEYLDMEQRAWAKAEWFLQKAGIPIDSKFQQRRDKAMRINAQNAKKMTIASAVEEAVSRIARGIVPAYGNARGGSTVGHSKGAQVGQGNIGGARNRGTPGYPVPPEMTSKRGQEGEVDGGSLEVLEKKEKEHTGTCIMLSVPDNEARELELDGGEPAEGMHITMFYTKGLTREQSDTVKRVWEEVWPEHRPLEVGATAPGIFPASESSDWRDVLYMSVEGEELVELHQEFVDRLADEGITSNSEHEWKPHITLKYLEDGAEKPDQIPEVNFEIAEYVFNPGKPPEELTEAKTPDDLHWGIKHIEDLKPEEFLQFLHKYADVEVSGGLEISEKVDGSARISFGLGSGHIWTQTKTGSRKALSSQYPDTAMFKPVKEAHKALESKREEILKAWPKDVSFMVAEVLYGKVPNSIEYGESRIIIHGVYGFPSGELNDVASKKAAGAVVKAAGGHAGEFKVEYKRTINPKDVMVDVKEEYESLGDLFTAMSRNDALGKYAKSKFQEIQKQVKKKLLAQLGKQGSAYGPPGGDIEGLVFRDLETGQMTKLVDQDYFKALNEFMWSWRNRLNRDVLGGFSRTVAKTVLGDESAASNRLVSNILAAGKAKSELSPEAAADTLIANYIVKNNLMQQGFQESFQRALESAFQSLERLKAEWGEAASKESSTTIQGKTRVMGPEVKSRTQESINDAEAALEGIKAGAMVASGIADPLTRKVALFKLFMGHKFQRLVDKVGGAELTEGGPIDRMTGATDLSGASRIDDVGLDDAQAANEASNWLKGITAATMLGLAGNTAQDGAYREPPPKVAPAPPSRDELIKRAEAKYALPQHLLPAMIHVESTGNPQAVSKRGAKGLMQINPITQQHLGVDDPHDEAQAIEGGAKYMRQLLDRFKGKLDRALAAYNAGPTFVAKSHPSKYPMETRKYIKKVKYQMRKLAHASKPVEAVIRETFSALLEAQGEQYVGATIGRYQPFHAGHAAIIRQLAQRYTRVLVFVAGLKQDRNNPFSYDLRLEMMEKSLPDVWSKVRVYPASIQEKGTGYIPGLVANVSQAGELDPKQPVTVLVGEDRIAAIRQQVEHNNKHMGEPGYYTGTIEAEALPGVKNDDDAGRISGTRLRAAIMKDDRKEIKKMLDPHLVSDPGSFEELLVKMADDMKKTRVSVEAIVEDVIQELGMGGLETGVGFTKGGAWGSSGWSRAILAGDEDGDEMFQQMLKSPSTRMLPMANHGTPNSDLPGINRVEGEPNEDELRQPTDLDEAIMRVFRRHLVVR